MFLFLRLLLAHLLGDYPLQTGWIYHLKNKGGAGKCAHSLVVFLVSVLFVYPYWGYTSMWLYLVGAALVHHLSDWVKMELNLTGSVRNPLWRYVADQIVHVATAAFVLLLPIGRVELPAQWPAWWAAMYNSNFCMMYGCLLVVATYFTTYFIEALKMSYMPGLFQVQIPNSYKYYGIAERSILFNIAFFANAYALLALIPVLVLRMATRHLWPTLPVTNPLEVALSFAMAIVPGLALRLL